MTGKAEKMFTFIKGYITNGNYPNTMSALYFARDCHAEQKRKSGEPYIVHPLSMVCHAISMGLNDDRLFASLILHDVVEDCGIRVECLPVDEETKNVVSLVTFTLKNHESKEDAKKRYYSDIAKSKIASLVKLIDRCHNVSTMASVFTPEKIKEYADETEQFVLPLIRVLKDDYPDLSNQLFILKYHLTSMVDLAYVITADKKI